MSRMKEYGLFLVSLMIALAILHFSLRLLSKVPVVGQAADVAQNLTTEGTL